MSAQSLNLLVALLAESQEGKPTIFNDAVDAFDKALCSENTTTVTANTTLVEAEALAALAFQINGTVSGPTNIVVPNQKKIYVFQNATTGGYTIDVKTATGTGVTLANGGDYTWVYCDGTNVVPLAVAAGLALQVNGTPNGDQSLLNLKNGTSVYVHDDGGGEVRIDCATGNTLGGVLSKTGAYQSLYSDQSQLLTFNLSGAATLTLPAVIPTNKWFILVRNVGTGTLTIARNGFTIDGKAANLTLMQGDAVGIFTDGSNWYTQEARTITVGAYAPTPGVNNAILLYNKVDRPCVFPASAPNSFAFAGTAATASTTYTLKKNGAAFATVTFAGSGTTGTWTQASDATFAAGDILEVLGPATADATIASVGITLQGYLF